MNIKLFQVRLDDSLQKDQENINQFMDHVTIKKTATQFVPGEPDFWSIMVYYDTERTTKTLIKEPEKLTVPGDVELSPEEKEIVTALKQWRKDKAASLNVPDFLICHNSELLALSKYKPRTMEDLGTIKGFGAAKISKHGDEIISVLNAF